MWCTITINIHFILLSDYCSLLPQIDRYSSSLKTETCVFFPYECAYQWSWLLFEGTGLDYFPNATITDYGSISGPWMKHVEVAVDCGSPKVSTSKSLPSTVGLQLSPCFSRGADAMMKEIFNRGPISCGVDANPLLNYESGAVALKLIRSSPRLHG